MPVPPWGMGESADMDIDLLKVWTGLPDRDSFRALSLCISRTFTLLFFPCSVVFHCINIGFSQQSPLPSKRASHCLALAPLISPTSLSRSSTPPATIPFHSMPPCLRAQAIHAIQSCASDDGSFVPSRLIDHHQMLASPHPRTPLLTLAPCHVDKQPKEVGVSPFYNAMHRQRQPEAAFIRAQNSHAGAAAAVVLNKVGMDQRLVCVCACFNACVCIYVRVHECAHLRVCCVLVCMCACV